MEAEYPYMGRNFAAKFEAMQNLGAPQAVLYKLQRLRDKHFEPGGTCWLFSRLARYPLYCRYGTSDMEVFRQIFVCREYRCLDTVVEPELIIDCGANVGYSSAYFLSRYPAARLIAIEPDPDNFAVLTRNIAPYGSRAKALRTGVWSKRTGLVMSEDQWGDNREWARTVRESRENEAPSMMAVDVGSLLEDSGADRISILKIDIEGAEKEIFRVNYERWIGKVDNLVIELHGDTYREVFLRAIRDENFAISSCDELTVCLRDRPSANH